MTMPGWTENFPKRGSDRHGVTHEVFTHYFDSAYQATTSCGQTCQWWNRSSGGHYLTLYEQPESAEVNCIGCLANPHVKQTASMDAACTEVFKP